MNWTPGFSQWTSVRTWRSSFKQLRKEWREAIATFSVLFNILLLPQVRAKLKADVSPLEESEEGINWVMLVLVRQVSGPYSRGLLISLLWGVVVGNPSFKQGL